MWGLHLWCNKFTCFLMRFFVLFWWRTCFHIFGTHTTNFSLWSIFYFLQAFGKEFCDNLDSLKKGFVEQMWSKAHITYVHAYWKCEHETVNNFGFLWIPVACSQHGASRECSPQTAARTETQNVTKMSDVICV